MKELGETLRSATDVLESLASGVECFLPKVGTYFFQKLKCTYFF